MDKYQFWAIALLIIGVTVITSFIIWHDAETIKVEGGFEVEIRRIEMEERLGLLNGNTE